MRGIKLKRGNRKTSIPRAKIRAAVKAVLLEEAAEKAAQEARKAAALKSSKPE